jgi:hypothetical protein
MSPVCFWQPSPIGALPGGVGRRVGADSLLTIAPNPNAPGPKHPRRPPPNPPHWAAARGQHLAAEHCEVALLIIVETGVKRLGRRGDALNFGGAATHAAGHCVETFDWGNALAGLRRLAHVVHPSIVRVAHGALKDFPERY